MQVFASLLKRNGGKYDGLNKFLFWNFVSLSPNNQALELMISIFLKFKIWRIEKSVKLLLKDRGIKPLVWSFGAYYIDPKNLVFVVGVPSDEEKDTLRAELKFNDELKGLLGRFNWPISARPHVQFDIESDRKSVV